MDTLPPAHPTLGQRIARTALAIALLALGLFILWNFLRALVWALILVIATWPLYRRARAWVPPGRHDLLLPSLFTVGATLVFVVPLGLAAVQLAAEAQTVAHMIGDAREHGAPMPAALQHLPVFQSQVSAWWAQNLADPEAARALLGRVDREVMQAVRPLGSQVLHRAVLFGFTIVTLFFLYRDGPVLRAQAIAASARMFGPHGERVARQMVASIHGTVDGLVLVGLGVGVLLGIAYAVGGVPHPALLGAATAVAAMIPLGAPVVIGIACLLALGASHVVAAAAIAGFGAVVVFVADHFVRPALIGGATRLPFVWVLLGILGGVETFGLLGLFLGPAVMAALILLWRELAGVGAPTGPAPETPRA
jgi:predicted PurR-regulated permease PerM